MKWFDPKLPARVWEEDAWVAVVPTYAAGHPVGEEVELGEGLRLRVVGDSSPCILPPTSIQWD